MTSTCSKSILTFNQQIVLSDYKDMACALAYLTGKLGHFSLKHRGSSKIVHPKLKVKTNSPAALSDSSVLVATGLTATMKSLSF